MTTEEIKAIARQCKYCLSFRRKMKKTLSDEEQFQYHYNEEFRREKTKEWNKIFQEVKKEKLMANHIINLYNNK